MLTVCAVSVFVRNPRLSGVTCIVKDFAVAAAIVPSSMNIVPLLLYTSLAGSEIAPMVAFVGETVAERLETSASPGPRFVTVM